MGRTIISRLNYLYQSTNKIQVEISCVCAWGRLLKSLFGGRRDMHFTLWHTKKTRRSRKGIGRHPFHCERQILWSIMFLRLSTWILSISLVRSAELIKVPLIQLSKPAGRGFSKRSVIGYSSLTDDVLPGPPYIDLSYLGQVAIGNPPQNFLLGKPPSFYPGLMRYRFGFRDTLGYG